MGGIRSTLVQIGIDGENVQNPYVHILKRLREMTHKVYHSAAFQRTQLKMKQQGAEERY